MRDAAGERRGRTARDVVHVNAHATSTVVGDLIEARSVREVLGADADHVLLSATKSMTGHLLGGAGALETIFTVLALRERTAPPTINVTSPDPELVLDLVRDTPSGAARVDRSPRSTTRSASAGTTSPWWSPARSSLQGAGRAGTLPSGPYRGSQEGTMRNLAVVIELALLIYALIDCIQTDSVAVRNLPKTFWVVLILFVPIVGPIVWLIAGRPERHDPSRSVPWPSTKTAGFPEFERPPRGPDDDPDFLAGLHESDAQHEQMLQGLGGHASRARGAPASGRATRTSGQPQRRARLAAPAAMTRP